MSNDATALITVESQAYPVDASLAGSAEACPACSTNIAAGETYCPRCGYQRGTWVGSSGNSAANGSAGLSGRESSPWALEGSAGNSIALVSGEQVFGRGEVEHRLDDSFVSRRHAKLTAMSDKVLLEDLGSSNGSFIAGVRLVPGEAHSLSDGDAFRLGQTDFVLRRVESASPADDGTALIAASEPAGPAGDATLVDTAPVAAVVIAEAEPAAQVAELSAWTLKREGYPDLALPLGLTTLGRRADRASHVLEGDSYVSGLHCQLEVSADAVLLTDLGSTNGTYIGETRLEPNSAQELADGAAFRVGQTELSLSRAES